MVVPPPQHPHQPPDLGPDLPNMPSPPQPPIHPGTAPPPPGEAVPPYLQPSPGNLPPLRAPKIDILCLLQIQSKPITSKPPAELTQPRIYPPKSSAVSLPSENILVSVLVSVLVTVY